MNGRFDLSLLPPALATTVELLLSIIPTGWLKNISPHAIMYDRFYLGMALGIELGFGMHKVKFYGDNSGPVYERWVGPDLSAKPRSPYNIEYLNNQEMFFQQWFVGAKEKQEPREVVVYDGSAECERRVRYRRADKLVPASYLIANTDGGRSYSPLPEEPKFFELAGFIAYLDDQIDDYIVKLACEIDDAAGASEIAIPKGYWTVRARQL